MNVHSGEIVDLDFKLVKFDDMSKKYFFEGGCIYIAFFGGVCKVGCSSNPYKRISTIQKATGIKFERIYISKNVNGYHSIEGSVHAAINKFRVCGEWHKVKPEVVIAMCSEVGIRSHIAINPRVSRVKFVSSISETKSNVRKRNLAGIKMAVTYVKVKS